MFTCMIWTLQLKTKSDTTKMFNQWVIERNSESSANYKVQRFHSDNGGEFTASTFREVCAKHGIKQTFSNTNEPRQNPYVERASCSINSLVLTSITTGNLDRNTWWRAQLNASNVLNSFQKEGWEDAPYTMYYQEGPDMSLVAQMGCHIVGYRAKLLNTIDPKWHPGSITGVYMGAATLKEKSGYTVLTEDGKVYYCVSADLNYNYFPYRKEGDRRITSCDFRFKNTEGVEKDGNDISTKRQERR
jgi:hypothetical protein